MLFEYDVNFLTYSDYLWLLSFGDDVSYKLSIWTWLRNNISYSWKTTQIVARYLRIKVN